MLVGSREMGWLGVPTQEMRLDRGPAPRVGRSKSALLVHSASLSSPLPGQPNVPQVPSAARASLCCPWGAPCPL